MSQLSDKLPKLPHEIYLTYSNYSKVPSHIWDQYSEYAYAYNVNFFNDDDCIDYLKQFDSTFSTFPCKLYDVYSRHPNGAHKADIWRYAILYEYGGIYFDIKTILVKPLDHIFSHNGSRWYTVISGEQHRFPDYNIHQGILATPPGNPIIYDTLKKYITTPIDEFTDYYWTGCNQLYDICCKYYNAELSMSMGDVRDKKLFKSAYLYTPELFLFEEICETGCKKFKSGEKRYGLHCWIIDDVNSTIFHTRDKDYGFSW